MKKNIIIIMLIVVLVGALVGNFILSKMQNSCPKCEVDNCDEKNCPKLEEIDNWNILTNANFSQNVYSNGFDWDNQNGINVSESEILSEILKNNKDKDKILNDIKKYDLESGTYILFESGTSGCGGIAPGIEEILLKGDTAVLIRESIERFPGENTCMAYITNVYGIYIPLKINNYVIVK